MNEALAAEFQALIENLLAELERDEARGREGQATVELDQQAVGRLSRMDALQNQAMAKAGHARRPAEQTRLRAALARIEEWEFDYCEDCGGLRADWRLRLGRAGPQC